MAKEEPTSRVSRIRGGLPGDSWKPYISEGTRKVYDVKLTGSRETAKKLRHRGRLVAAHRAEKRAYRIRVRGYDRKRRGEEPFGKQWYSEATPFGKGITVTTTKLGPFKHSTKEWRIRKPTKAEERRKTLKAVGQSVGGVRTIAALGAGAGISEGLQDFKNRSQNAAKRATTMSISSVQHPAPNKNGGSPLTVGGVKKSMDIYEIIGKSYDDAYDLDGLVEIQKVFGAGIFQSAKGAFRTRAPQSWQEPAEELFRGAKQSYQQGGVDALGHYGAQAAAPYLPFSLATGAKAAGGIGGAGAVGVGGLLAARAGKQAVKKKLLKGAAYTGAGLAGATALGTAAGNAVNG